MKIKSFYFGGVLLFVLLAFGYIFGIEKKSLKNDKVDQFIEYPLGAFDPTEFHHGLSHSSAVKIPSEIFFCGEKVPLGDRNVYESLDFELIVNTYRHSRTLLILKKINRWRDEIEFILEEEGVPKDLFYVAVAESELRNTARSHAGAMGMWQFMERTGREYRLRKDLYIDQRRDPVLATRAACKYFKKAYARLGSWTLAAASYNMGMSGVSSKMRSQNVSSYYDLYLNRETARYVFRILSFKQILENPSLYGFDLNDSQLYKSLEYEELIIDTSVINLLQFASEHSTNYKTLRNLNPWFNNSSTYKIVLREGEELKIRVPLLRE